MNSQHSEGLYFNCEEPCIQTVISLDYDLLAIVLITQKVRSEPHHFQFLLYTAVRNSRDQQGKWYVGLKINPDTISPCIQTIYYYNIDHGTYIH